MPAHRTPDADLIATAEAIKKAGSLNAAAVAMGVSRNTLQSRLAQAVKRGLCVSDAAEGNTPRVISAVAAANAANLDIPELPDELPSASELLDRRKRAYSRKHSAHGARSLITITVRDPGPIGIMHMGDPHVDDDGTDIGLLESHVKLVNDTPGLYAGNVGDYSRALVCRGDRMLRR